MKYGQYEVLAKKGNGKVFTAIEHNKTEAEAKAKKAASRGFSVLVIGHKDDKKVGSQIGPKTDWSKYCKIVEVTLGTKNDETEVGRNNVFTYRAICNWEAKDGQWVNTPKGKRWAIVVADAHYVHVSEIQEIEDRIGYALKRIEEVATV